jgi:hypothetical protein
MNHKIALPLWGAALALTAFSPAASAGILRTSAGDFLAGSGLITFSEFPLGTANPLYAPATYGGGAGSPTVTFDGYFTGQALGNAASCPAGAALSGCVVGSPTGPLSLAAAAPNAFIASDGANPTSPVLSGTPTFNGAIAILFSIDVAGVGLEGGFFNAVGGTSIQAFSRAGALLGSVSNTGTGIEFLGLVSDTGANEIAGLLFSLVGPEPAGFAIDNLRFGAAGQVASPNNPVPEPGTLLMSALGASLLLVLRRR